LIAILGCLLFYFKSMILKHSVIFTNKKL